MSASDGFRIARCGVFYCAQAARLPSRPGVAKLFNRQGGLVVALKRTSTQRARFCLAMREWIRRLGDDASRYSGFPQFRTRSELTHPCGTTPHQARAARMTWDTLPNRGPMGYIGGRGRPLIPTYAADSLNCPASTAGARASVRPMPVVSSRETGWANPSERRAKRAQCTTGEPVGYGSDTLQGL